MEAAADSYGGETLPPLPPPIAVGEARRNPERAHEPSAEQWRSRLLDAKVKGSGESGPGGCGMWVWIVGASVVFAVPFFTFAWKTK